MTTATKDTCGTCGDSHRTNLCTNKDKRYCVTCKSTNHTSWDRNCPEFNRRCYLVDKKNLENSLTYFPTEQDWTLAPRPTRIPLNERFPAKYAVNSLPITYPSKKRNTADPKTRQERRTGWENPNLIPITRNGESREEEEFTPPWAQPDHELEEHPLTTQNRSEEENNQTQRN